jgi:hypothetical protein
VEDFVDGDEMNAHICTDRSQARVFARLSPNLCVMDTSQPFKVSGALKMPTPVVSTIFNFLDISDGLVKNGKK